jgi:integrase
MDLEVMKKVLKLFNERKSCNHDRDLLVIRMMMETGCRPSEVLKSEVIHFDFSKRIWYVPSSNEKTGHFKTFYLSGGLCDFIQSYICKYKDLILGSGGFLIFSRKGGYLEISRFSDVYNKVITKAGLFERIPGKKTHCNLNKLYSIRGVVFIYLHKKGFSLEEIKTLSQHSNVSTLERWYVRYNQEETQKRLVVETSLIV